jgi:hypothetical protein
MRRFLMLVGVAAVGRVGFPVGRHSHSVTQANWHEATGLSLRYVSLIRRGERTPHPRHWEALQAATEAAPK